MFQEWDITITETKRLGIFGTLEKKGSAHVIEENTKSITIIFSSYFHNIFIQLFIYYYFYKITFKHDKFYLYNNNFAKSQ